MILIVIATLLIGIPLLIFILTLFANKDYAKQKSEAERIRLYLLGRGFTEFYDFRFHKDNMLILVNVGANDIEVCIGTDGIEFIDKLSLEKFIGYMYSNNLF